MREVTKAKYTFWRTIVDLAKSSGIPEDEWCRKNCISFKTYRHYDGIFRRQEARKSSYYNGSHEDVISDEMREATVSDTAQTVDEEEDRPLEKESDSTKEASTAAKDEVADHKEDPVADQEQDSKSSDGGESKADPDRYFEVPIEAIKDGQKESFPIITEAAIKSEGEQSRKEAEKQAKVITPPVQPTDKPEQPARRRKTVQKADKEAEPDNVGKDKATDTSDIIIEAGGMKLVIGSGVDERVLEAVLMAVKGHA